MFSLDDLSVCSSVIPTQNIDYLDQPNEYLNNTVHLHTAHRSCKEDSIIATRLRNACWRRIHQNLNSSPRCSPEEINWNKDGDITWLYGPRYEVKQEETHAQEEEMEEAPVFEIPIHMQLENQATMSISDVDSISSDSSVISDCDNDTCSLSSYDSGYVADYPKQRAVPVAHPKRQSNSNYYGDEEDDCLYSKKSNIKSSKSRLRKQVSFNYIISTREIINGRTCDYDFLDEACL